MGKSVREHSKYRFDRWKRVAKIRTQVAALGFAAVDGMWIMRSLDEMLGINPTTKKVVWRYQIGHQSVFGYKGFAYDDNYILVSSTMRAGADADLVTELVCITIAHGEEVWRQNVRWESTRFYGGLHIANGKGFWIEEGVDGSPAFVATNLEDGTVIFNRPAVDVPSGGIDANGPLTAYIWGAYFYCCHREKGLYRTSLCSEGAFEPVVADTHFDALRQSSGNLFAVGDANQMICLDESGDVLSEVTVPDAPNIKNLVALDSKEKMILGVSGGGNEIACVDLAHNDVVWRSQQTNGAFDMFAHYDDLLLASYRTPTSVEFVTIDLQTGEMSPIDVPITQFSFIHLIGRKLLLSKAFRQVLLEEA